MLLFRCWVDEWWVEVSQLRAIGENEWEENRVFTETFQDEDPESHISRKEGIAKDSLGGAGDEGSQEGRG